MGPRPQKADPTEGADLGAASLVGVQREGLGHEHRDEERYLAWASHLAIEVPRPQPGDVGLWRFGRCYSHAGIFVDVCLGAESIIHAWSEGGKVRRDPLRMGRLSTMPGAKGPVPRPVKYFDVFAKQLAG